MSVEVEYLSHIVTPQELKPNKRNLDAVKEFPVPTNVKHLKQFLGLTSHYRRFILNYAKTAQPLYNLTKHGIPFVWTADCEQAFDSLKSKLLMAPILAYPDFTKDFVLETDASKQGLGAILSQLQDDSKLHPLAYASHSLSSSEKNYAITELKTLAVVRAITHFRYHLYDHRVTVYTDHVAVKAVLGAPNLDCKHARWWNKVNGSGIREVDIVYRAKHNNCHADEQWSDLELRPMILYLRDGELPNDVSIAKRLVAEFALYTMANNILYYVGSKSNEIPRAVVPATF